MEFVIRKKGQGDAGNFWFIVFLCAALIAIFIFIAGSHGKKWLVAIGAGIIGVFVSFVLYKDMKHLFLFLMVFLIPLRIDFYVYFKKSYFTLSGYPGFPITAFDIVFASLFLFFLFQVARGEEKFEFFPAISVPAILFLALTGISVLHAEDRTMSFFNFLIFIKSFLIFLYFANRIQNKADINLIATALIFAIGLQVLVGGMQYLTGGSFLKGAFGVPETSFTEQIVGVKVFSRVGGTIGHPNGLGRYLSMCITVLIGYVLARVNRNIGKLAICSVLLGGIVLLLTLSRQNWVALGLTLCFIFYQFFRHLTGNRTKALACALLINLLLSFFILAGFENVRMRLFSDDYHSARGRIEMAQVAWNVIKTHPLTGVGLNNYTNVMQRYDRTSSWQTYKFIHPVHNSYLLIAAETGIPALAAFLWLIGAFFKKSWMGFRRIDMPLALFQIGCVGGVLTWIIAGMLDRDLAGQNEMLWFIMGVAVATDCIIRHTAEKDMVQ